MAKYKAPIKATRRSVRVLVPGEGKGGEYAETSLHEEYLYDPYLATSRSEGGRRWGALQFSRRTKSGKYKRKAEYEIPGEKGYRLEASDHMKWTWDRDIRLLVNIGITIAVFIICYTVMSMVFDAVGESMTLVGLSTDSFNSFRVQAQLCIGVVVALIVGAGAGMFLFKEGEVDDEAFEA